MPAPVERQLLFAILAFQNNFIDRKTLLSAFDEWSQNKQRTIAAILFEQKVLAREKLAVIEALVAHHLEQDAGDAGKSLGHVASRNPALSEALRTIADADVRKSLEASLSGTPAPAAGEYATMAATMDQRPQGAVRFKVLRPHAKGGLGEVYVAEDGEVPREVALKQMQARHSHDADSRARFIQEAEITGGLEHPNIVPVYGLGVYSDGRPYYAMRFIRGDSFEGAIDRFHQGKETSRKGDRLFKLRKLLQRFIDVCNAIEYAHSRGVLHRDLKPANIMLGKFGETLVVDWGLAKIVKLEPGAVSTPTANFAGQDTDERPLSSSSADSALPTQMGSALGTPNFMSPEQAAGRLDLLGPASDVYSLGATLYYLLTGRTPFTGNSVGEILRKVQVGDFPPPRQANPAVDRALDAVCRRAMALKPADRYSSARGLADDLERWLADEPVRARKESAFGKIARWTRKNRTWTMAGFLALATVSIVSASAAVLIQESKVSELRAVRIAAAADSFSRGLQVEQWDDAHLAHLEQQIAELRSLGHPNIDELQESLATQLQRNIARRLQAASITEDDVRAVEGRLALLESRKPAAARALREAFAARLRVWQPLFSLVAPYARLTDVFDPATAQAGDGAIVFTSADPKNPYAMTRQSADGVVQLQAMFDAKWDGERRVGLALRSPDGNGYEFLISAVADSESKVETTFVATRSAAGVFRLEVRRNGGALQRLELPAAAIEPGPLRISVERMREKLSLHVNEKTRLDAYDPFPLPGNEFVFAVLRSGTLGPAELRAARQAAASQPSPLETADRLYDAGDYSGALTTYVAAAGRTESPELRREAAFKQGLCLASLERPSEAIDVYRKVAAEEGERWPAMATLHLWFLLEREQRTAEADVTFESLASRYRFDQLAALIPQDLRTQLFAAQSAQFDTISSFAGFNLARLKKMEQIAEIDRLLSPDGRGQKVVQWSLLRGFMFADDLQRALPLAERIYEEHPGSPPLRNYVRLLCWTGNPKKAVDVATRFLASLDRESKLNKVAVAEAHLCRARAHIAGKRWEDAARDVDEANRLIERDPNHAPIAAALRGWLLEREGMIISAVECYRKCFLEHRTYLQTAKGDNTGAVLLLILGARCGELTDQEAADRLLLLIGANDDSPTFKAMAASLQSESLGASVRSMWLTPHGRRAAEENYILESATMASRLRSLVSLIGAEIADRGAFGGRADEEQRLLLQSAADRFHDAVLVRGELSTPQLMQLVLAWKGTVNFLGWGGVAPTLAPELRAEIAYVLGARLLRRGGKADAEALLKEAVEFGGKDSPAAKLAAVDLELLRRGVARVRVIPAAGQASVRIKRDGKEVQVVNAAEPVDVELPPGNYDFALTGDVQFRELSVSKLKPVVTEHAVIDVVSPWKPSEGNRSFYGLVSAPAAFPQIGAWQCDTLQPRGVTTSVCWSPDDRLIACITLGQIRIYDPSTWKLQRVFRSEGGGIVAWSSQGTLALSERAGGVRIATLDGKIDRQLPSLTGTTHAAAWSNDGKVLATSGGDSTIRLWTADGEPLRTIAGHENVVNALAWSSDDKYLLSGSSDGTARIWTSAGVPGTVIDGYGPEPAMAWRPGTHTICTADKSGEVRQTTAEGTALDPIRVPPGVVRRMAWSPDGKILSVAIGSQVFHVDPERGARSTFKASGAGINSVVWSHGGATLATACGDAKICLWDRDGKQQPSLDHNSQIRSVALSTDGAKLGIARVGKPMMLASDGRSLTVLEAPAGMWNAFAWNPSDGSAASAGFTGKEIHTWNADGTVRMKFNATVDIRHVAWSPDGKRIASMAQDGKVLVFDSEGKLLASQGVSALTAGSNPKLMWRREPASIAATYAETLIQWDEDLKPLSTWQVPASFRTLRFWEPSPQGERVLLGGAKGAKVVPADADWSAALTDRTTYFSNLDCSQAVWSSDGKRAAVGTFAGKVFVFDADGSQSPILDGHNRVVTGLGLSSDGLFLYSGSADGTIRKWDVDRASVEWVAVPLAGDQLAVFAAGGCPLFATEKADQQLVYLVERPDQSWDAITPEEFRRRIAPVATASK